MSKKMSREELESIKSVREFFKDVDTYPEYVKKINMLLSLSRESFERWLSETASKKNKEAASQDVRDTKGVEN